MQTFTGLTLKTAGSQTVTATDTVTSSITGSATVTVSPAAASTLAVTAPASVTTGVAFSCHRHRQGPLRQHRYRLRRHGPLH